MQATGDATAKTPFGWIAAGVALLAVLVVASKGWIDFIQDWASYFWWLGYGDGLVRRGLAGQLFQLVFGHPTQKALYAPLMSLTAVWMALLALTLAIPFARTLPRLYGRDRATFLILSVGLFVSQLWPMLAFTAGYLDPLLLVLATGAALCLRRGWIWPAAAIAAVGPVVHEFFVFLVPFVLASALPEESADTAGDDDTVKPLGEWEEPKRPPLWPMAVVAGASLLAGALVILFSKRGAAEAQFQAMPLGAELKSTILATSMNQSLTEALGRMLEKIGAEPGFAFCNVLFFVGPAFLACLGLLFWRRPLGRTPWLQAAAGLLPGSAILIAWDLSRFLVITTFTAGALFLWAAERRNAPAHAAASPNREPASLPVKASLAAMLVFAAAYALYPFAYIYFGYHSFFQYFPPAKLRTDLYRSALAPVLESVWGHQDDPFTDQDVTCRLQPAGDQARACAHPIKTGDWIYGPYVGLPLGRYRLSLQVTAPPGCTAPFGVQVASFRARSTLVASTEFKPAPVVETSLDFRSGLDTAARGDFEFRTSQVSGEPCGAELRKMTIRRLGP